MDSRIRRIRVIDSHTGGEPTRVVISGGPDLGAGALSERVERFRNEYDDFRRAVVHEPRGSDAVVGALLCTPVDESCVTGVIFFNSVSYLGMCGHGTIGIVATLAYLNQIGVGSHRIETPVGVVVAHLDEEGKVEVANVPSYRLATNVMVDVPRFGPVTGDVAWGGNWFFLLEAERQRLEFENIEALTEFTWRVRQAVNSQGYPEVDHVELYAKSPDREASGRNFVLCPGKAYDRSPCGTGTSAKLACLAADDELAEGATWTQESIIGSAFTARYRWLDRATGRIAPTIRGRAHVTAQSALALDPADPFCWGIRSPQ